MVKLIKIDMAPEPSDVRVRVPLWCHCHRGWERRLNQGAPITAALPLRLGWPQWQGAGIESVG